MEERSLNEKKDSESETTDTTKKRTRQTHKTKYPLPDGRISVDKLIKVIQALCTSSNKGGTPVSYQGVTPYADIHKTQVSGALNFLYDVELVTREKYKYTPKQEIVDFCSRVTFKDPNAGAVLRKKILETWFGEHIVKLFEIHSESTKVDIIKNIGIYAQADKYHQSALGRILDYLVFVRILDFDEATEKYKLAEFDLSQELPTEKELEKGKKENPKERITTPFEQEITATKEIKPPNDFRININVSIDENSDVEAIAKKLIDLKRELHSSNKDETQNS
jgi:hypothetical protein